MMSTSETEQPPKKTRVATSCTRPVPILRGTVSVVPRPDRREVVAMDSFEILKNFPHTEVLLQSGALLACCPSTLQKHCAALDKMILVGTTISIDVLKDLSKSIEHTSELQSLTRNESVVVC